MSGAMWAQELDVFGCALDGVNQIEASAGTGKTWNICALYVRLLLEKNLNADQILVVTFTKAATAELHERIRGRLAELHRALETGDDGGDPFIAGLFDTTLAADGGIDRVVATGIVRRALRTFDQAAIHTIHAFCQRALQEAPFAAAMPFAFEMEADDAALRFELAADFWREQVEPVAADHPAFAAWLVGKRAGPASLDEQLARRLKKPLAQLRWGDLRAQGELGGDGEGTAHIAPIDPQACFSAAHEMWTAERDAIVALLAQTQDRLKQTSHKPDAIDAAVAAWTDYFAQDDHHAPPPGAALKLTASALKKATKVKFEPPEHAFFTLADDLAAAVVAAEIAQRARWLDLVQTWLEFAPTELAARKRTRRVVSFDDLLSNLYRALAAHPWLADALRARYPAALIDEFQDTDPLQFAIFNRIFAPAGPLFLVGDPKQAIYSFRAADLHTYLAARAEASACYTLAVNQRSTAPIVEACNRIFAANPQAFVLDGLTYQQVRAGERQRDPFVDGDAQAAHGDAVESTDESPDFRIWTLPQGDAALTKREAQRAASEACAAEIVRLLRGAREQAVTIGDEPLAPGNIAVLVQTHRQGSQIKRVLATWGVGSVELAQASVFATLDAEQIERVLAAVDTPGDLRRLRAALATDWLGLDAAALWQLEQVTDAPSLSGNTQEHAADAMGWVERFSRYRTLWHERGFAVMWRTLMRELGIAQRLVAGPDGERRLTDVNHLAELVQARAASQPGIAPTLRWLGAQREQGGGEEAQLRLESDRNLVQIVTVHKSKGLEYAVVFCPFLNDGALRDPPSSGLPDAREYHDEDGAAVLHYGCDDEEAERAARYAVREQAAERARLVYVALTRAVYRCYLVAGTYVSSRSTKESRRSVLNWLVAGAGHAFDDWLAAPPDEADLMARWQALAGGPIALAALPLGQRRVPLESRQDDGRRMQARTSRRVLRDAWRLASFSALVVAGARADEAFTPAGDARPDHDEIADLVAQPAWPAALLSQAAPLAADDILAFPRGAAAGECLHRMFELADFSDRSRWPEAIVRALRERPAPAAPELAKRLPTMMLRLLDDVVATELVPGMTLAKLNPARRMNELEFLFTASSLDFSALRNLLTTHGYPDVALEPGALRGFVKGFIDMIVEHDGKFWIVDWKSNHLGDTPADYTAVPLEAAMAGHAYHLQALLYTVALHRYLKARLRDYAYDEHIGGYLYLFVRGVRPGWCDGSAPTGVHARQPDERLVMALDALMDGRAA
ncbi:exodeoxyribonuclease V subunit beta [Paraburkholderia megapolitana]|uniref:RecBCD enzyme subunit RecB n=1 Tax=Paraburkholderia megapolitana TaxID=420953 RepID=A0A1I3R6P0_9BURK|nr:exodeoxyribonuclease V subunit beta [Paraburkholderia megapolitana]QDQ83685.1 exodeoxyribonuclease V subunit beta [Paraburkholderia megapolitana]SFJ41081.1 DNA helicase/exodeoxyribonuclease V, beta subunit [Paraburkholderia megapolitana]